MRKSFKDGGNIHATNEDGEFFEPYYGFDYY